MINQIISTIIQCVIFIGIPWMIYFFLNKEMKGFFAWVGLYLPKDKSWIKPTAIIFIVAVALMGGAILIFAKVGIITEEMLYSLKLSKGLNFELLLIVLIKATIQTSLSEEVFFRGFIGKRVARKFGYFKGNLTQSILFGLPHGLPFIIVYQAYLFGIVLFIAAATVGFLQFYLNEKKANGSIIPSLIIHSLTNIISNI